MSGRSKTRGTDTVEAWIVVLLVYVFKLAPLFSCRSFLFPSALSVSVGGKGGNIIIILSSPLPPARMPESRIIIAIGYTRPRQRACGWGPKGEDGVRGLEVSGLTSDGGQRPDCAWRLGAAWMGRATECEIIKQGEEPKRRGRKKIQCI